VPFVQLLRRPRYVVGLVVDLTGFIAAAAAMQYLPLFMVQAGVASSVGVTAVLAAVLGARLPRQSVVALVGMLAGLVLLAVSARAEPPIELAEIWRWALVVAVIPTAALAALAKRLPAGRPRAITLSLAAGLGFTWVAVAARTLDAPHAWWLYLIDPTFLAIALNGLLATTAFGAALEHGSVTLVSAVNYATETVLPSAIGLTFLGDRVREGFGGIATVGFVLAVAGALSLAGSSARIAMPTRALTAAPV
jgi:drug/metabolite transporter (DMT)-like permease